MIHGRTKLLAIVKTLISYLTNEDVMIWFQFGSRISFLSQNANLAPTGPSLALDHLALNQIFKSERGLCITVDNSLGTHKPPL